MSTARKIASVPGIAVHPRRELTRTVFNHVPVTTASQTLLDLATVRPDLLPRALGQLDYRGQLDTARIAAALGSGVRGAAALRGALTTYDPNVARLNDEFEIAFYALCADWGIDPLPIPNVEIQPGLIVDALWPEHHLGVELDGRGNHHSDPQLLRDADRDLICRRLGLSIIRYRRAQLRRSPDAVREDLQAQLVRQATTAKAA